MVSGSRTDRCSGAFPATVAIRPDTGSVDQTGALPLLDAVERGGRDVEPSRFVPRRPDLRLRSEPSPAFNQRSVWTAPPPPNPPTLNAPDVAQTSRRKRRLGRAWGETAVSSPWCCPAPPCVAAACRWRWRDRSVPCHSRSCSGPRWRTGWAGAAGSSLGPPGSGAGLRSWNGPGKDPLHTGRHRATLNIWHWFISCVCVCV